MPCAYGGDEFVITLKDVNADMLTLIADQILGRIRTELTSAEFDRTISCSLGAVLYVPQDSTAVRADALIKEADRAMYEAKRRGGGRVYMAACEAGKWELAAV
ncbi:MAG: diguanylate cyclase [Planctomycetaceae bacterium]